MKFGMIHWYNNKRIFWFRLFGYGLKDTREHKPLFGERNGFVKVLKIGSWSVRFLGR